MSVVDFAILSDTNSHAYKSMHARSHKHKHVYLLTHSLTPWNHSEIFAQVDVNVFWKRIFYFYFCSKSFSMQCIENSRKVGFVRVPISFFFFFIKLKSNICFISGTNLFLSQLIIYDNCSLLLSSALFSCSQAAILCGYVIIPK